MEQQVATFAVKKGLAQMLKGGVIMDVVTFDDYQYFVGPFAETAVADGRQLFYLRFAPHSSLLTPRQGLETIELNPRLGFDHFTREVHRYIESFGSGVLYVFDNLSALVVEWATDELLANFFQITCPLLSELNTVAYFALTRNQHSHNAVARIRDTTQILVDVYQAKGQMHIHPIKVWDRYSPQMFLPHPVGGDSWLPLSHSSDAVKVLASAYPSFFFDTKRSPAPWESVYQKLLHYRASSSGFNETVRNPRSCAHDSCDGPAVTQNAWRRKINAKIHRKRLIGLNRLPPKVRKASKASAEPIQKGTCRTKYWSMRCSMAHWGASFHSPRQPAHPTQAAAIR